MKELLVKAYRGQLQESVFPVHHGTIVEFQRLALGHTILRDRYHLQAMKVGTVGNAIVTVYKDSIRLPKKDYLLVINKGQKRSTKPIVRKGHIWWTISGSEENTPHMHDGTREV